MKLDNVLNISQVNFSQTHRGRLQIMPPKPVLTPSNRILTMTLYNS